MRRFVFFAFLIMISRNSFGSNWHALGPGFDSYVCTIYYDSIDNKIYTNGPFAYADSVRVNGIAVWDGTKWDSLGSGIYWGAVPVYALTKYHSQIYSDGGFVPGHVGKIGGIFNGISWTPLDNCVDGHINQFKEINNLLWVGGFFSHTGTDSCSMLATWDGSVWNCLNVPYNNDLQDFLFYNNNLTIAGNILDSSGNNVDIASYDSSTSSWSPLGGGILGGISYVRALAIYHGELYAAGYFTQAAGNAGNFIMKWDGFQWEDVGGGTDSWILCMKVYNDELYVGGVFNYAGGVHTGNLAKWNGIQWMPATPSIISPSISEIQFYNGELYIGGGFTTIDTIIVNYIARYDGPLAVGNFSKPSLGFYLSPNPSNSTAIISFSSPIKEEGKLTLTDPTGKQQFRIIIPRQTMRKELDISELAAGVYLITLESESGRVTKKFIKE